MPSSWSPSLRFELQFTGENINLWGEKLNAVLGHADYSVAGWLPKTITGDYSLTTANAADDEARAAMLKILGPALAANATITIPAVSKSYFFWNATAKALTITTGAGATVTLAAADKRLVFSDGAGVYEQGFGGSSIKDYVDNLAWTYNAGALPAQGGNAGKFVKTDGTTASWQSLVSTDLSDYATAVLGIQVALAVAL